MTLSEGRDELYRMAGKNSELDPATASGAALLDGYLNRAYAETTSWKVRGAARLAFPCQRGVLLWQNKIYSGTASAGTSTTITIPTTGLVTADGYYQTWCVYLDGGTGAGQTGVVVGWAGSTGVATMAKAWSTTPDATTTWILTKNWVKVGSSTETGYADMIPLDPQTVHLATLKISSLEDEVDLSAAEISEGWVGGMREVGTPTSYLVQGLRIYFDVAPDAQTWWRIEHSKKPIPLTATTDEFNVPSGWEAAVVLRARWWVLATYGETEEAYAAKKDFEDVVAALATGAEEAGERTTATTRRMY